MKTDLGCGYYVWLFGCLFTGGFLNKTFNELPIYMKCLWFFSWPIYLGTYFGDIIK